MVIEKKLIFKKSFLFFPLLLFLFSQLLSTVFSIDLYTSIFGYYSRFHGGLLSTISYLLLFWALVSNGERDWVDKLLNFALISGSLVAGYGILEHFGIDKNIWVQDVQNRVFSTLGQPNWLAAYLNILLMIVFGRLFLIKEDKQRFVNHGLISLFYLCLLYTKSRSGFLGFLGGGLIFSLGSYLISSKKLRKTNLSFLFFPGLIILSLSLIVGTPFSPSVTNLLNKETQVVEERGLGVTSIDQLNITPSSEIRKIVWTGAIKLWQENLFLGTGVETFAYSYYWVRPAEHNLTSEWDFLYNKAHNEYLNFAATTGSLGLITYLLLPVTFLVWIGKKIKNKRKQEKEAFFLLALVSGLSTVLITNFFGFSVVVISLWFFLFPAFANLLFKNKEKEGKEKELSSKQTLGLAVVGILTLLFVYQIYAYWQADYHLSQGLGSEQAGLYEESLEHLEQAISLRGNEALYHDKLGLTLANLAWVADKQGDNQAREKAIEEAIEASNLALGLSPYQLNYYRDRARMFFILSQIDLVYLEESLSTMIAAIELAPTDAKLYYNAGLMFASLGEEETSQEYLKRALELKPNYDRAQQFIKDD